MPQPPGVDHDSPAVVSVVSKQTLCLDNLVPHICVDSGVHSDRDGNSLHNVVNVCMRHGASCNSSQCSGCERKQGAATEESLSEKRIISLSDILPIPSVERLWTLRGVSLTSDSSSHGSDAARSCIVDDGIAFIARCDLPALEF